MSILTVILIAAYVAIAVPWYVIVHKKLQQMFRLDPDMRGEQVESEWKRWSKVAAARSAILWPYYLARDLGKSIRWGNEAMRAAKERGLTEEEYIKERIAQQKEDIRLSELTSYQRWAEENGVTTNEVN